MNKEKELNNQFKSNENSGEHRNGRLSPFKNHRSHGHDKENEYVHHRGNE